MDAVLKTAKNCRHYAMCKIDYLGTGLCRAGAENGFVSYYPQGRMDLYAALREGRIPVTERTVDIAGSCDLCGICNCQCYFVTEIKPMIVMESLKELVDDFLRSGGVPVKDPEDEILNEMRGIVGHDYATSDRAVAVTYSHDPSPVTLPRLPDYVVMPGNTEQVMALMKLIRKYDLKWAVRGNGSSVMGFVMSDGVVIDMGRMKEIRFDEKNWKVRVGPGVPSFELQKQATARGYRVNVAEPAALVCANILCSGIFSTFSAAYGTLADNIVDAEFVSPDGTLFSLNDPSAPNIFAFEKRELPPPGICVSAEIKLHPVSADETGILVPFEDLEKAVRFAKDCSVRRIGLAIGILGGEYVSTFISPTTEIATRVRHIFSEKLRIQYLVQVIGDKYAIRSVREMGLPYFDQDMFRTFMLGLPALIEADWLDIFRHYTHDEPFGYLKAENFKEIAETALMPSAEILAETADPEIREFLKEIYNRPEMSDLVWLNTFRIVSSRMGREKHVVAWIVYMPVDYPLISAINEDFRIIASRHQVKNDFGFITPLDFGKRCVLEYDYFLDQNDPEEITRMQKAMLETSCMIEGYAAKGVRWIRYVLYQGMARSEGLLYC